MLEGGCMKIKALKPARNYGAEIELAPERIDPLVEIEVEIPDGAHVAIGFWGVLTNTKEGSPRVENDFYIYKQSPVVPVHIYEVAVDRHPIPDGPFQGLGDVVRGKYLAVFSGPFRIRQWTVRITSAYGTDQYMYDRKDSIVRSRPISVEYLTKSGIKVVEPSAILP